MTETTVSVIIPAYNEVRTIGDVVKKIRSLYRDFEIIVINDGSTDDTEEAAKEAGAWRIILQISDRYGSESSWFFNNR